MKNYGHYSYANREPHPQTGETVFGGDRPQQWRIREMKTRGQYMYVSDTNPFPIATQSNLYQCLPH